MLDSSLARLQVVPPEHVGEISVFDPVGLENGALVKRG